MKTQTDKAKPVIADLVEENNSAGRSFRGKVNGKPFRVWRNIGNGSQGNRYTRGLVNEPRNWHVDSKTYERVDGRSVPCDYTTARERRAAKAACMAIVFPNAPAK